jgi:hypothetical protein
MHTDFSCLPSVECLDYLTYDVLGMEIVWIFTLRLVFKGSEMRPYYIDTDPGAEAWRGIS